MQDMMTRMADLEIRQAFQDDTLQTLSDIIAEQQQQLEWLKRQLEQLKQQQAEQPHQDVPNEPPPHY